MLSHACHVQIAVGSFSEKSVMGLNQLEWWYMQTLLQDTHA